MLFLMLTLAASDVRVYAQGVPPPGTRLALSPVFAPPLLKGIKVFRNDPFRFDFILDKGDVHQPLPSELEIKRLIKYFLASLTVPEKDLWVNLSPYEKDRIVPEAFGQTEMGRDLLAQDYILKQITASVIYPDEKVGKEFWSKVYAEAQKRYGTTDIPVDTFNKVWITPAKATVYEHQDAAYVVESRLKVMLESDYKAAIENKEFARRGGSVTRPILLNTPPASPAPAAAWGGHGRGDDIAKQVLRDVIIPILNKEVNEGQNFATLRQVYNSLILATWYKRKVKTSIMGKAYVDQKKVSGIDIADKNEKEKIWSQYVEAFKRGAFNLIKEEKDTTTQEMIPRQYFSGGADMSMEVFEVTDAAMPAEVNIDNCSIVNVDGGMLLVNSGLSNRKWVTTDLFEHNPRKFMYSVKMSGLARLLKPPAQGDPISYSLALISDSYLKTFNRGGGGNVGLVFDFADEDVLAILASMNDIAAFDKTEETQREFIKKQLKRDPSNVMYQTIVDNSPPRQLAIVPEELIRASIKAGNKNNEVIVKNNLTLQPKAIILIVRCQGGSRLFREDVDALKVNPMLSEVYSAMTAGKLPVVIVGENGSPLKTARRIFKHMFRDLQETRPFFFEKKSGPSPAKSGFIGWIGVFVKQNPSAITRIDRGQKNSDNAEKLGGIDLDPAKIDLSTKNSGGEIAFNLDPAMLARMQHASGISPVIVSVHPMESLSAFLGIVKPGGR